MASKRRSVWVLAIVVVVAVGGAWWWQHTANKRHVSKLIDTAYEYTELRDGRVHTFSYYRETYTEGGCPVSDGNDWVGNLAGKFRFDEDIDPPAAAERAAVRFEDEGWNVSRYINGAVLADTPEIVAWNGVDHIWMAFTPSEVSASASSGPCNRDNQPEPPRGARVVEVDDFDP